MKKYAQGQLNLMINDNYFTMYIVLGKYCNCTVKNCLIYLKKTS